MTLRIVIAGHVDHGKSTILGRLLHDTGSLADGKAQELEKICAARGSELEWSFLLDAFQAERDQAVTIDTTQVRFSTKLRPYVMIDAPGHKEFIRNMMSGAAEADAAILVIDAAEGIQEQTRRHAELLRLVGITQIALAVNKMDAVGFKENVFRKIVQEAMDLGFSPAFVIPLSARHGDMIAGHSNSMKWHEGKTLVDALDSFSVPAVPLDKPLRFSVQDIYRENGRRIIVGRVESGILRKNDELFFSPYNQQARVESIEVWPPEPRKTEAFPDEAVGITLDRPLFVERGHIGSHVDDLPMLSHILRATLACFSPLQQGATYTARIGMIESPITIQSVDEETDATISVTLRAHNLLPLDQAGRIILLKDNVVVAGGASSMEGCVDQRHLLKPKSDNIQRVDSSVTNEMRAAMNGHTGGVFWLTGLSAAGKTALAMAVEKALFDKGYKTYVLDGDNIRHGLNVDLGFSPTDRAENIRRVGQMAELMADSGLIVLTAFISPFRADRELARAAAQHRFHEIHVRADLKTCEARDPKGLYKKARSGEIHDFTGIGSPYEAPETPELVVDTQNYGIEDCLQQVLQYIEEKTALAVLPVREKTFVANS